MKEAALLVMDMQTAMISQLPDADAFTGRVASAIAAARAAGTPIIYVIIGFRPGAPELNLKGKGAAASKGRAPWTDDYSKSFLEIHPRVAPQAGDIVVTKRRVSAFTGSDLEVVLRAQGIKHLVLTGFATSGVVLSTVREAADKDYQVTVLADGCMDRDEEVQRVLMTKIFPRQADVVDTIDFF